MPDNSANRAAMRAAGHSIRCFASFIAPSPIVSGTVTNTPPYPVAGLGNVVNVTYLVGAYTDIDYGMEVVFETPGGDFKARTHIRYGLISANANNIFVREFAQASVNLEAGDLFKVYAEWRMHDKLVAAQSAFPPDFRYITTENDEPEPVANSGGDWAGMVDGYGTSSELTYATVQMTGSTSFTVYPTGGSVTHLWTLPSGVAFAPGSANTDANPVLRANVGTYVITHAVTDVASGKSRKSHPSIRVHDGSNLPHRVLITSYTGEAEAGWNWEVDIVTGAVDFTTIPDGCKVILWGRERINGSFQSFRNASPGRSHILGIGYAARDTSSGEGEGGTHRLSIEVVSPIERMKQIKSYSKVMIENASPDDWSEIYVLGVLRGILQISQYYFMLVEAGFDLIVDDDFLDERYPAHFLDSMNFYDQMMDLAKAVDARLVCDRAGRFDLHTHPAYIPLADRAAVTVALTLADADILEYEWTREHFPKVAQMKVSGISGGTTGNTEVFSLYPGAAAGEAIDAPEIARLILDATTPQDDINERAGRYGALNDMVFYDDDGIRQNAFDLRLKLRGSYDVFDFYKEYVEVTIADNARDLDLTGLRFYLLSSSTDFDADTGTTTTDLVLRMETNAAEGETFVPPTDNTSPGDGQPPPWQPPVTVPADGFPLGTGRYIIIGSDGGLYYTATGNSATPVWAKITISPTGTPLDFVPYAFSPYYLTGSGDLYLYLATTTRIARVTFDASALSASLSNQATYAAVNYARIETERGTSGFLACVLSIVSTSTSVIATTDGATWGGAVSINAQGASWGAPGMYVSGRSAGKIYTAESSATAISANGKTSTNYGVSFATLTSPNLSTSGGQGGAFGLHIPWHNNSAETIAYFGHTTRYAFHDGVDVLYRVNGTTQTDISPTDGTALGAQFARSIDTAPNNRLRAAFVLRGGTAAAGDNADKVNVYSSMDGGTTMTTYTALNSTVGAGYYTLVRVLGDGSGFLAGGTGARLSACDFAGNSRDISGNLAALGCSTVLNIAGW